MAADGAFVSSVYFRAQGIPPRRVPPLPYEYEIRAFIAGLERENAKNNVDNDDDEEAPALNGGRDLARLPAQVDERARGTFIFLRPHTAILHGGNSGDANRPLAC